MIFLQISIPIFQLFLMMALGFFLGKKKIFSVPFNQGMTWLIVWVTLPALIFSSLIQAQDSLGEGASMFIIAIGAYLIYWVLAFVLSRVFRFPTGDRGVFEFALVFSNVGFMGYPIVEALLGREQIFLAAVFNIPFQLLVFSLGVLLLTEGKEKVGKRWKLLLSPGILATLLGLFFLLTEISLPQEIISFVSGIGETTTFLSMVLIGSLVSGIPWKGALKNPHLWILSFLRLLFIPLVLFFVLTFLGVEGYLLAVPVLIAAMPVAANAPILAEAYGGNGLLAGEMVLVTTLLSFVTLPLWAVFLGVLGTGL